MKNTTITLTEKELEFLKLALENRDKVYGYDNYDYDEFQNKFGIDMDESDDMGSLLLEKLNRL
jgi:hypothetical protein